MFIIFLVKDFIHFEIQAKKVNYVVRSVNDYESCHHIVVIHVWSVECNVSIHSFILSYFLRVKTVLLTIIWNTKNSLLSSVGKRCIVLYIYIYIGINLRYNDIIFAKSLIILQKETENRWCQGISCINFMLLYISIET